MAEPTDEATLAAGKRKSATLAATLPKVNPKTGVTSDLFTGKYGVFEALLDDPIYGPELREIKAALEAQNQALADDLWNRSKWGRLDTDAQSRILMRVQNENLYKERLKSWLIGIKSKLVTRGIKADDKTLEKYYTDGIDDATIIDELTGGITAKDAAGQAADALSKLRGVARANGFNLDTDFVGQVDGWLQRIAKGESVDDFARIIRSQAKLGLPEKVGVLLDEGLDLANIYAPYRNRISTRLNIPVASIPLNDSLLSKAITKDGDLSLTDFDVLIRQDPRWALSDDGRATIANAGYRVIRDMGFEA